MQCKTSSWQREGQSVVAGNSRDACVPNHRKKPRERWEGLPNDTEWKPMRVEIATVMIRDRVMNLDLSHRDVVVGMWSWQPELDSNHRRTSQTCWRQNPPREAQELSQRDHRRSRMMSDCPRCGAKKEAVRGIRIQIRIRGRLA